MFSLVWQNSAGREHEEYAERCPKRITKLTGLPLMLFALA